MTKEAVLDLVADEKTADELARGEVDTVESPQAVGTIYLTIRATISVRC